MTGVEILSEIGLSVASRLVASGWRAFFLRHRVSTAVGKAVDFDFPRYKYRNWLNRLKPAQLAEPLESGGAGLAASLDSVLCASAEWKSHSERSSRALLLVKATYTAMLNYTDASTADRLRDGWASARQVTLLEALTEISPAFLALSRADRAELLLRESAMRRAVRLEPLGIASDRLIEGFAALRAVVPQSGPGTVTTVVGPVGSGKSELAEEWFRDAVTILKERSPAPEPLWLHASEMLGSSLRDVIERRVGAVTFRRIGVAVVVDGLDEIDSIGANRIVDQARVLAGTEQRSRFLLTSRPGVLSGQVELVVWDGLDRDAAISLVEAVSGSERATWSWNPSLIDAVRRPFFALSAGVLISEGVRPTGQAEMIALLVERALARASSATATLRSPKLTRQLSLLAVSLVRTAGAQDGMAFTERQQALASGLVQVSPRGSLQFSLPIFQQWFAARALLDSPTLVDEAMSGPEGFDRWRWVLAIAGTAAGPERLDQLLETIIRSNPGAGAWVLARIADGHRSFRAADADAVDTGSAGARLLRAMRSWINAFGVVAPLIYPVRVGRPITLGVRAAGNRVDFGWQLVPSDEDRVIELPEQVHPLARLLPDGWWADRTGAIAEGDEWPWILSQDRFRSSILRVLNNHTQLGPVGGVWHTESRYRAARRLVNSNSALFPALSKDAVMFAAQAILAHVDEPSGLIVRVTGGDLRGEELLDLVSWLAELDSDTIVRPAPVPDADLTTLRSSWIWDFYTERGLQEFYASVFGFACDAFDQAVESLFSSFAWSLGTRADGEFGVIADISYVENGWGGNRMPIVTTARVPLTIFDEARTLNPGGLTSSNGRAFVTLAPSDSSEWRVGSDRSWIEAFVRQHADDVGLARASNPFSQFGNHGSGIADDTNHSRPASSIAARWLFDDLKALGLADGTFPQLQS